MTQIRTAIRHIDNLVAVIEGRRTRVSGPRGIVGGAATFHAEKGKDDHKYLEITRYDAVESRKRTEVRLHCDPETCSIEEWENKKALLTNELLKFKQFLSRIPTQGNFA